MTEEKKLPTIEEWFEENKNEEEWFEENKNENDCAGMTEEKKLTTIEEWFEENKNEEGCAGMTVGFQCFISDMLNKAVNKELSKYFSNYEQSNTFMDVEATLDLVFSKDENGRIVYFIDDVRWS